MAAREHMITFTFAGDEAGDVSFSFDRGASRFFVVAVVATQTPDSLRAQLAKLRQQAHLPHEFDFHFNRLASAHLRRQVFSALKDADFDAWAIIVDKSTLPELFRVMSGLDVYLYFVSELIRAIPIEQRMGGTLILDEYGSPKQTKDELRRVMKARQIAHGFRRILVRHSHSESLIQVADLVAGAVLRRDARKDSETFDYIQAKMRQVVAYDHKNLLR
jgi:hypothetical protein